MVESLFNHLKPNFLAINDQPLRGERRVLPVSPPDTGPGAEQYGREGGEGMTNLRDPKRNT